MQELHTFKNGPVFLAHPVFQSLHLVECNEMTRTGLHPRIIRIRNLGFSRHPRISADIENSCGSASADGFIRNPHTSGLHFSVANGSCRIPKQNIVEYHHRLMLYTRLATPSRVYSTPRSVDTAGMAS